MQFAGDEDDGMEFSSRQPQVRGENLHDEDEKEDVNLSMQMSNRENQLRRGSGRTPEKWEDKLLNNESPSKP